MILPLDEQIRSEPRPELRVAGVVRLIALIEVKTVRDVVLCGELMIDTSDAVPEVRRPRERYTYGADLNRCSVDPDVLWSLIACYRRVNILQESERGQYSLSG